MSEGKTRKDSIVVIDAGGFYPPEKGQKKKFPPTESFGKKPEEGPEANVTYTVGSNPDILRILAEAKKAGKTDIGPEYIKDQDEKA